jgi:hypothetical protein
MNPYLKIKTWYENKLFLFLWKRGLRKSFIERYGNTPSRTTKILSASWLFWLKNWGTIILIILSILGIAVTLYIHYDK